MDTLDGANNGAAFLRPGFLSTLDMPGLANEAGRSGKLPYLPGKICREGRPWRRRPWSCPVAAKMAGAPASSTGLANFQKMPIACLRSNECAPVAVSWPCCALGSCKG